jgi:hypothetical protein
MMSISCTLIKSKDATIQHTQPPFIHLQLHVPQRTAQSATPFDLFKTITSLAHAMMSMPPTTTTTIPSDPQVIFLPYFQGSKSDARAHTYIQTSNSARR